MNNFDLDSSTARAISMLMRLIEIPSYSRDERSASDFLESELSERGIKTHRYANNIVAYNRAFDKSKPTILLNSHIDTVKPATAYSRDPHRASIEGDRLYGLGSNDAGAALVSLIQIFCQLYDSKDMKQNIALAISAEEEVSGRDGMELLVGKLPEISLAVVGEPTSMQMAISERGLLVVDCLWRGKAGHAARGEGENAIYKAIDDIRWVRDYRYDRISPTLGATSMNLTIVGSGSQHNVVPDECRATIDIRITDSYTFEDILNILREHMSCEVTPRSLRLRPSYIRADHPIVEAASAMGIELFGSPTLSDQALMPFTSVKIGPGDSARSHSADEYILISQIKQGIETYRKLIETII